MHKLFAGVDGGGTNTIALVTDECGQVLGRGESGPSNYLTVGLETAAGAIRQALDEALAAAGAAGTVPASACFGLAGAARREDVAVLTPSLSSLAGRVLITHDAAIALAGALGGGEGAIVVAGTGSCAYGEAADGRSARSGGWGWLVDDAGGGYDVGRRTLQAGIHAYDGRGPATDLTERLLAHWGLSSPDDLVQRLYRPLIQRHEVAGLARLTADAANSGDRVAVQIWQQAGCDLAEMAAAVLRRLQLRSPRVAGVGSLWKAGSLLADPFRRRLGELVPDAVVTESLAEPAGGAALLARRSVVKEVIMVDNGSGHLYQRIKEYLQEEIDAGRLAAGDRVPSERELAERFNISRMTVRHALTELVNEGTLYRYQGKGTFVARPKIRQGLTGLTSFTEDMRSRGLTPGARVLSVSAVPAPYKARKALGLDHETRVVRIERLRLADDEPMALEVTHLPYTRFANLESENLEDQSLYQLLKAKYGINILSATQTIEPAVADGRLAEVLSVPEGALLLLLERTTVDERGEPVEFVSSYYRGDRYRFVVELQRR